MSSNKRHPLDLSDGGYASRKLLYAVGTSVLVFATGMMAAFVPSFRSGLETVVGGLVAALGVYCGANVSSRYVTGKNLVAGGLSEAFQDAPQASLAAPGATEADCPDPRPPVEPVPEERR